MGYTSAPLSSSRTGRASQTSRLTLAKGSSRHLPIKPSSYSTLLPTKVWSGSSEAPPKELPVQSPVASAADASSVHAEETDAERQIRELRAMLSAKESLISSLAAENTRLKASSPGSSEVSSGKITMQPSARSHHPTSSSGHQTAEVDDLISRLLRPTLRNEDSGSKPSAAEDFHFPDARPSTSTKPSDTTYESKIMIDIDDLDPYASPKKEAVAPSSSQAKETPPSAQLSKSGSKSQQTVDYPTTVKKSPSKPSSGGMRIVGLASDRGRNPNVRESAPRPRSYSEERELEEQGEVQHMWDLPGTVSTKRERRAPAAVSPKKEPSPPVSTSPKQAAGWQGADKIVPGWQPHSPPRQKEANLAARIVISPSAANGHQFRRFREPDDEPAPEPTHWVGETDGIERKPRFRDGVPSNQRDFYRNPGGGYGRMQSPDGPDSVSDANATPLQSKGSDWIQPREEMNEYNDDWRNSWEMQRKGVAGRFNRRNRGL